jgi:threonine/homoserine/homoserine lactone efflux protein
MTGFVRVMANPSVLLFWIILAANFISRGWVGPGLPDRLACVAGVAVGVGSWWLGLSWASALGRTHLSDRTLLWIEKSSGVALLIMAAWHGVRLTHMLAARAE